MDLNWDLKSSFNPSCLQPAQQELQNRGTKIYNTVKFNTHVFNTLFDLVMGKDKTKDEDAATSTNASRDAALAKTIAQAVAEAFAKQKADDTKFIMETFTRQLEKTQAQYEELLKASCTQNFPSTLKVTSSSDGFRVMDPFDWTMDKNIYQRWQLWSHKAKLALDAMEGDNEKTKISYLHHWLDGKGISKIKGWKNSKILISNILIFR